MLPLQAKISKRKLRNHNKLPTWRTTHMWDKWMKNSITKPFLLRLNNHLPKFRRGWNYGEPHRNHTIGKEIGSKIHIMVVGTTWDHTVSMRFAYAKQASTSMSALLEPRWTTQEPHDLKGNLMQNPRHDCWGHMEPHRNHTVSMRLV